MQAIDFLLMLSNITGRAEGFDTRRSIQQFKRLFGATPKVFAIEWALMEEQNFLNNNAHPLHLI